MPQKNFLKEILERAKNLATSCSRRFSTVFILLAIVESTEGELKETLDAFGLTLVNITSLVVNITELEHEGFISAVILNSKRMANFSASTYIKLEHIMLGLLSIPHTKTRELFECMQVDVDLLQQSLYRIAKLNQPKSRSVGQVRRVSFGNGVVAPIKLFPIQLDVRSVLVNCSKDITLLASQGKLDPVIGRDEEMMRAFQVLSRRKKCNPVLIGDAGVGKTSIVEGLARMIVLEPKKVPPKIKNKKIFAIDVSSIVAGTSFRGQFEEKLNFLLQELVRHPDIIIFIDELHTIVGAGSSSGNNMDVSNILKPALARGEFKCIGATTLDEYRKIEKDEALERRFQMIMVNEPSEKVAEQILLRIIDQYESFHNVRYENDAIRAAVRLSVQYIPERNLPDKAIDLLDEAGSRKSTCEGATVTESDIAEVIHSWTGVMILTSQDQKKKILELEKRLKEIVIGQDEAIEAIAKRMVSLRKPNRPIGSFIFLGPTGVGKTHLAKKLAEHLFGNENTMIRMDMSEYQEKHTISKLVGAPPGYVGHDEGGQLTEKVRRKPFSLILFDEIEKAHEDIFDILLQILDDGHLTDGHGREVNFKNTIIIMTSNIISSARTGSAVGFGLQEVNKLDKLALILREHGFKMEFLNRIDEIVLFHRLSEDCFKKIVNFELQNVQSVFSEYGLELGQVPQTVKNYLIRKGFKVEYGARELRRTVEKLILTPLGKQLLEDKFKKGDKIKLELKEGKIIFNKY